MRTIRTTGRFKQDYKRVKKGRYAGTMVSELDAIVTRLANDLTLEPSLRDHQLAGDWRNHRDCHLKPDLVLIYRKPDETTLELVRLGSHAELGW